ncbi:MAG: glycosyltransferase family 2 protein [Myxococcales bacterium]|nr:glycosyltransferase family 2 protein [Myxococcales bacterium]
MAESLTLLIPVYNGGAFLARSLERAIEFLGSMDRRAELLVIDDGSTDETPRILSACRSDVLRVLRNERNRGKGHAVRRGLLEAKGELIVFTDADLTYPLENVQKMLEVLGSGADVAYGSRMHSESRYVVAPGFFEKLFTRHLMGRSFNLLTRALVLPGVRDTQAGLKGFRRPAARELAERMQLERFSFDLELLFIARQLGLDIRESPVLFVYNKERTTVRFARDAVSMLGDMLRVRWRGVSGAYHREINPDE